MVYFNHDWNTRKSNFVENEGKNAHIPFKKMTLINIYTGRNTPVKTDLFKSKFIGEILPGNIQIFIKIRIIRILNRELLWKSLMLIKFTVASFWYKLDCFYISVTHICPYSKFQNTEIKIKNRSSQEGSFWWIPEMIVLESKALYYDR